MQLNLLWFILIGVLFTGYFVLEGFDFGVGILLPFLGKSDNHRRIILNTIGPHWDGNEVWLITAGGAIFAAFPQWYATLFSGFYLPLFLILLALIFRGVALEFRSKDENRLWRGFWDWAIFAGSLVPALLWGVAFANLVRGVPIDGSMNYAGGFWNLLNPFALLTGLFTLDGFMLHGAIYLSLKTPTVLADKARKASQVLWMITIGLAAIVVVLAIIMLKSNSSLGAVPAILSVIALVLLILAGLFVRKQRDGRAFGAMVAAIVLFTASFFAHLYPNLMISSLNPLWSLTLVNSASGPNTLRTMTNVALILVPIMLAYQAWSYWVFRKRITTQPEQLEY